MRILIYSYNYYPEPIGIAPLMTELAENLVRRGHQVRVVTGMPNYPQRQIYEEYQGKFYLTEERNHVTIQRSYVRVRGPHPTLLDRFLLDGSFVCSSFLQAYRGWRPDVVFVTVPPLPVCVPVALFGWLRGCPIVLNVQDIVSEAAVRVKLLKKGSWLSWAVDALERFAYKTSSKVSVIAEGFKDKLISQGVSPDKIVCIPNWVDTNFIKPLPQENNSFRQKHHLEGKFVVLYSGNIALTQGLQTVIKAAASLREYQDIVFVIVGEEIALRGLEQDCHNLKATNVLLLPFQPRAQLPEMLAAADVGLVVQKHRVTSFNMPSKIPLLLASGRAIIASVPLDGTAARGIRESGGGVIVPPEDPQALADQVLALYRDRQKVKHLGEQGRRYALEHYSLEQALNQYENLFMSLTKRRQPQMQPLPELGRELPGDSSR
ncbi:glycosyltransferase family 4 protein [Geitlerinema calcuttense]|uniref:Glycosyltransferase family 4 protein n=1 Tax=Geitlerinema calcuttense NRMC-F 0142 TaxID=2922238 RepID=A0ABT7LWT5_9CYAN|nr:glycosyltransferase family 4 protein [Geitlerinema calcuttense]MCD8485276.1 glycosyltransferase family 4 protein [Desertifilum sp.]MDL5056481.1 glycosyltransferase family 4 protein [Geitlerinema calcuttense NRMC-F 0142]